MKVQIYKIDNSDACIQEIITIKSDNPSDSLTHFVPPFGSPEIIFYIGKTQQIKNVQCQNGFIKGQYTNVQKIDFVSDYHFLSIRLQPYGLKRLFNIDASQLQNAVLALEEHPTSKRILSFIDKQTKIDAIFLRELVEFIEQLATNFVSQTTLDFVKSARQTEIKSVKNSIADKGLALRTFQRNFKKEVGLTPKVFLKIIRMNAIERQLAQNTTIFQIIADFDFSDQSHLIKEFKQLRNNTPMNLKQKKLFLKDQLGIPEIVTL